MNKFDWYKVDSNKSFSKQVIAVSVRSVASLQSNDFEEFDEKVCLILFT